MVKRSLQKTAVQAAEPDEVFELAAEVFRVMSAPMRLKIISSLCDTEKNVGELLAEIETTQPNMSQHLSTLYRAGVLGKRRDSTQIYYRLHSERVATLCRAVCTQIAIELDSSAKVAGDRMAAPTPCNARLAISQAGDSANPMAKEAAENSASPVTKTRRRPSRSPARAPSNIKPPKDSA